MITKEFKDTTKDEVTTSEEQLSPDGILAENGAKDPCYFVSGSDQDIFQKTGKRFIEFLSYDYIDRIDFDLK